MPHPRVTALLMALVLSALHLGSGRSSAAETTESLRLAASAVCRGVVDRTPIGKGSVFAADTPALYCFTHVVGAVAETAVVHRWYCNGKRLSTVRLPVKSASWRTYSRQRLLPEQVGDWRVEIWTRTGRHLETILFFVR